MALKLLQHIFSIPTQLPTKLKNNVKITVSCVAQQEDNAHPFDTRTQEKERENFVLSSFHSKRTFNTSSSLADPMSSSIDERLAVVDIFLFGCAFQ